MRWRLSRKVTLLILLGLVCLVVVGGLGGAGILARWLDEPLASTAGQLAFISDRDGFRELYLMNADGSQQTRLTYTNGDIWLPAWSPDGRYLAFVQGRSEEADIYIIDVEAALLQPGQSNPTRLTNAPGFDGYPAWSPAGTRLAFGSIRGLYLVDMVAFAQDPTGTAPTLLDPDGYPVAWSADGSRLAIEVLRALFVVQADGSGDVPLGDGTASSWSSDSNRLVFSRAGDLYRVDADGTNLTGLTSTPGDEYGAAWSPDGQQIAYILRAPGNSDMGQPYIMNADGSGQQQLNSIGADQLAWSPDSTRLALYSNRGKGLGINGEIWVMNRDGSGLTVLTNHPAFDGWPTWRP